MARKTIVNKKLKNRYRLLVMNDETFEEKFSLTLTPSNVWIAGSTAAVLLILLTAMAIIYTPLKYFIPGFSDYRSQQQVVRLQMRTDSLEQVLAYRNQWLEHVQMVLGGTGDSLLTNKITSTASVDKQGIQLEEVTEAEQQLRKKMEEEDNFAVSLEGRGLSPELERIKSQYFIPPVTGLVTQEYDAAKGHFGMDIATPAGEPVKAATAGVVISASWTLDNGHELTIQHADDLISVYKHNSRLLKKSGDVVRAGEVVAIAGNTGEQSTGVHVHLELWVKGKSVNPRSLIQF